MTQKKQIARKNARRASYLGVLMLLSAVDGRLVVWWSVCSGVVLISEEGPVVRVRLRTRENGDEGRPIGRDDDDKDWSKRQRRRQKRKNKQQRQHKKTETTQKNRDNTKKTETTHKEEATQNMGQQPTTIARVVVVLASYL